MSFEILFQLLIKNFWLVATVVNLFNMVVVRQRIRQVVRQEPRLLAESHSFFQGICATLVLPFLLLAIFQWLGNFDNALYFSSTHFTNLYVLLSWAVFICLDGWIVYWIFGRNGAATLSRFRAAFRNMPESTFLIKLLTLVIVAAGSVAQCSIILANAYHQTPR
jgi:hypothetical protein